MTPRKFNDVTVFVMNQLSTLQIVYGKQKST